MITEFHATLSAKYAVKRLGRPTEFLGWIVSYSANGRMSVIQPVLFYTTLCNAGMHNDNGRHTTYNYADDLNSPGR